MKDGILDLLYYRNPQGNVAISLDEGETVIIPSGKRLRVTPVWVETDEEGLESRLTQEQADALAVFRVKPPMTDLEQMVWKMHKRKLAAAYQYAPLNEPSRKIMESAQVVVSDLED
jgi:hypothetical protein